MKTMAVSARLTVVRSVAGLIFLFLAGCALPSKPMRPQPYDLGPPPPLAATAPPGAVALALEPVVAPAALDGTQIIYRMTYIGDGQQPRPYAQARWSMAPSQLLTQRLRQALSAQRPVVEPEAGLAALQLHAELDEFAHVFTTPDASEGVVRLRVTMTALAARGERLLGQRNFTVRQPAATPDAFGAAGALRAASDEAVRQVLAWINELPVPH
jgi:cholesterol transport system auxiliary component